MSKINVIDDSYVYVTREADRDDKWDRDSTRETHSIQGILESADRYCDIETKFDVVEGKDYFLLYYLYATGDSFGTDEGKIEFVELYEDEKLAYKAKKLLNEQGSNGKVTIPNAEGKMYEEYVNNDYFGGFEHADVETVRLR